MLVRSIRRLAEKAKEEAAAPAEPRRSASDRRHRESEKDIQARRFVSGVSLLAFFVSLAAGGILAGTAGSPFPFVAAVLVGIFLLFALKVANQWERAVVLRFGKFRGLKGPGLFFLIPVVEEITAARGPARARDGRVGRIGPHEGHRARQRGRHRLLDGVGRAEVGPRGRGLPRRRRARRRRRRSAKRSAATCSPR